MDFGIIKDSLTSFGIDTAAGLEFACGDEELYLELVSEYVQGSEEKISEAKKCLDEDNLKDYGTIVHSLKSTSKTIGALALSEKCAALEKASDEGDTGYISGNHDEMIADFKKLISNLYSVGIKDDSAS